MTASPRASLTSSMDFNIVPQGGRTLLAAKDLQGGQPTLVQMLYKLETSGAKKMFRSSYNFWKSALNGQPLPRRWRQDRRGLSAPKLLPDKDDDFGSASGRKSPALDQVRPKEVSTRAKGKTAKKRIEHLLEKDLSPLPAVDVIWGWPILDMSTMTTGD